MITTVPGQLILLMGLLFSMLLSAQPENPNFSLSSSSFFEVDLQSIAILDIESTGMSRDFNLDVPLPSEAGSSFGANPLAVNSNNWINYSCAVPVAVSRNVEVSISSGSLPSDFELQLDVGMASGAGGGTLGSPAGASISLSSTPQEIITGIRGSYTGDGAGNGHQLTYSLHYLGTNFHLLESQTPQISITYTIIDD